MTNVSIDIKQERFADYKTKFLKVHPNTETKDDTSQDPDEDGNYPQIPKYTDNEWLKEFFLRFVKNQYRRGEKLLYSEGLSKEDIDPDIT